MSKESDVNQWVLTEAHIARLLDGESIEAVLSECPQLKPGAIPLNREEVSNALITSILKGESWYGGRMLDLLFGPKTP